MANQKETITFYNEKTGAKMTVRTGSPVYNTYVKSGAIIVQPVVSESSKSHSSEHVNTSTGSGISMNVIKDAVSGKLEGTYVNNITAINNTNGEKTVYNGVVINGVTYDVNNGQRIVSGGNENQSGLIEGTKNHIERDRKNDATTVWYTPEPKPPVKDTTWYPSPSPSPVPVSPPVIPDPPSRPSYPSSPEPPHYESFTQPQPSFSSDLKRIHKFTYYFGIDKVEVKSIDLNLSCARITREIELEENEGVELVSKEYVGNEASVEYSIIDGDNEVPVLCNGSLEVKNEKIFFGLPTRFDIDDTKPVVIKKDGVVTDLGLNEAMLATDGLYYVSYTAKDNGPYRPVNNKIKVKFVLRLFDRTSEPPYVKSVAIKMIGGKSLWQEIY